MAVMRPYTLISAILVAAISAATASAQIKIVPQDRLKAVSEPILGADSAALSFDVRHIVAEPMNEDDLPKSFVFPFINASDTPVKIHRLVSTCSCAAAICLVKEVQPGESSEIIVSYNPKGHPGKFERKVFVYTQDGNDPAAVLRLSVDVTTGADISAEWPVQMGPIRLRRSEVKVSKDVRSVETLRFINVSVAPVFLQCETAFLPECLSFSTEPAVVGPGKEGQIKIAYDPAKPGRKDVIKVILKGLGLPPSKSTIIVINQE